MTKDLPDLVIIDHVSGTVMFCDDVTEEKAVAYCKTGAGVKGIFHNWDSPVPEVKLLISIMPDKIMLEVQDKDDVMEFPPHKAA